MSYIAYIYPQTGGEAEKVIEVDANDWSHALKQVRSKLGATIVNENDQLYIRTEADGFTAEIHDPYLANKKRDIDAPRMGHHLTQEEISSE